MAMTDQPITSTATPVRRPGRWFAIALLGLIAVIVGFLLSQTTFVIMHLGLWYLFSLLTLGGLAAIVVGLIAGCVAAIRR